MAEYLKKDDVLDFLWKQIKEYKNSEEQAVENMAWHCAGGNNTARITVNFVYDHIRSMESVTLEPESEDYTKYRNIVRSYLSTSECLDGIAEECAELTKACMKYIRAIGVNKNWTPVTRKEVLESIKEEITDILCYFDVLGIEVKPPSECEKWERWAYRVENRKDMEE